MDGVLVDFERGVVKAINDQLASKNPFRPKGAAKIFKELGRNYITLDDIKKNSSTSSRAARSYMYALVEDNEDWWAKLPWQKLLILDPTKNCMTCSLMGMAHGVILR